MGFISIKALFDGKAVQTGLERVSGQAKRVGAELDKSFSITSMGKSFFGAFAGLKVAEILVNPLKEGLAYLEKMAAASRNLADVQARGFISRNSTERNIPILQKMQRDRTTQFGRVTRELEGMPDFANSGYAQAMAKVSETMGLSGVPGSVAFQKNRFDSLTEERNQLAAELTQLGNEIINTTRELEQSQRRVGYDRDAILDQRRVRRGEMSGVQAAENAAMRAAAEHGEIRSIRGAGVEADAAMNALRQAQDVAEIARVAFEKDRVQGVLPQLAASSLAQLGGGGNVNVFGGREGEGVTQLREQTRLLRSIDGKIAARNSITLDVK
ncbi:MAG: hypothetical protein K0R17_1019 [Rariglobus sp.]|jgi:hypothetical protein|nr:hypothetical protein [Rariglobus sp.]